MNKASTDFAGSAFSELPSVLAMLTTSQERPHRTPHVPRRASYINAEVPSPGWASAMADLAKELQASSEPRAFDAGARISEVQDESKLVFETFDSSGSGAICFADMLLGLFPEQRLFQSTFGRSSV